MSDTRKIGVLDSGVGGLTGVREFEKVMPGEDLLYYGDSKNRPYSYQSEERLIYLLTAILDDFAAQNVKAVAFACNTISTLLDHFDGKYPFPIYSIVKAGVDHVLKNNVRAVGIACTKFTAASRQHERLIHAVDPSILVCTQSFYELSSHIQNGEWSDVPACIEKYMEPLEAQGQVTHIILGCTHYPIAREYFEAARPHITFIDPAQELALQIRDSLAANDQLSGKDTHTTEIYTSGDPEQYRAVIKKLGISDPKVIAQRIIVE